MHDFKKLKVWESAVKLTTDIYKITESFPDKEKFGIIIQIRRSAVSIPSNIAEGAGRDTEKEFSHFLSISLGSSYELQTQLIIAQNLNYITNEDYNKLNIKIDEIQKMICGLKKSMS